MITATAIAVERPAELPSAGQKGPSGDRAREPQPGRDPGQHGHVVRPGVVTVFLFARHLARNAAHRLHCLGSCSNLSAVTDMMASGRLQTGSPPVLRVMP